MKVICCCDFILYQQACPENCPGPCANVIIREESNESDMVRKYAKTELFLAMQGSVLHRIRRETR